jgi:hypothetical protein
MSESTPGAEPTPEQHDHTAGAAHHDSPARGTNQLATMNRLDLGIVAAGFVAFLASLMPYYTISFGGIGGDVNAWHGFFGWFGAFCALVGAAVLAAHLFDVTLPVPVRLVVLALFGLALLCTLLALFVTPGPGCDEGLLAGVCDAYDEGHGFGYWLALLATIAGTALAAMRRSEA